MRDHVKNPDFKELFVAHYRQRHENYKGNYFGSGGYTMAAARVTLKHGEFICVGYAKCSLKDTFHNRGGLDIAFSRLDSAYQQVNHPEIYKNMKENFSLSRHAVFHERDWKYINSTNAHISSSSPLSMMHSRGDITVCLRDHFTVHQSTVICTRK